MILPRQVSLEAIRGMTFDSTFTVYAASNSQYLLPEQEGPENWNAFTLYQVFVMVAGSDGKAYLAKKASKSVNPVGDVTGTWEKLTPVNITGWTGEGQIGGENLSFTLGGESGSVRYEASPTVTSKIASEEASLWVSLTNGEGKKYEYVRGVVKMSDR